MRKLFVLILSVFLVCNCFAEDNNNAYDAVVETTANAYVFGSKAASFIGNKAKDINDEYEITDNIKTLLKIKDLIKKLNSLESPLTILLMT